MIHPAQFPIDVYKRQQLTLSYDMTFVALLLSALYDEPVESSTCKCVAHPFEAHATSRSVFTDYAADMNLLLSYYKCLDDWTDERKWKGRLRAAALRGRDKTVEARYPEKAEHIYTLLEHIHLYENCLLYTSIDWYSEEKAANLAAE